MTARTISVCVIGNEKVGKSQLLLRFAQQEFGSYPRFDNYERDFEVYGHGVKIRAFDTAGLDEYAKLRQLVYSFTDIFLVCCACNNVNSLYSLEKRWLDELRKSGHGKTPLILVVTKCDLRNETAKDGTDLLSSEMITQVASKLKVVDYFECSAKTGENVEPLFKRAAELVIRGQGSKKRTCVIV